MLTQEPTPPDQTRSGVSLGQRRITGEFVEIKTNGNGTWVKVIGVCAAVAMLFGTLAVFSFYTKTDGKTLEAKFEGHVESQKAFESDIKETFKEVRDELKQINRKLDKKK